MANYTVKVPLSVNGIKKLKTKIMLIENNLPSIRDEFMKRSLSYIEERAKFHIQSTTGGSEWYVLTHNLENSFVKDYKLGTLINECGYSALVEYGTGIVGSGTHPSPKGYQYDVNSHGEDGWRFVDEAGNLHFTKGMKAHRFMYDAVNDYYRGEYKRIFNEVIDSKIGGIAK